MLLWSLQEAEKAQTAADRWHVAEYEAAVTSRAQPPGAKLAKRRVLNLILVHKCVELSVAAAVSAARCALRLPDSDAMMNPSAAVAASSLYQYRITGYYWLIRVFVWGIQSSRSCGSIRSGR